MTLLTVVDANDANTYNQEPLAVRKSCKPGDVAVQEQWLGCSKLGGGFVRSTNFVRGAHAIGDVRFKPNHPQCLMKPNTLPSRHTEHLCMGVCNDDNQKRDTGYSTAPADTVTTKTLADLHMAAAKEMAADNQKLFTNAGVYSIIASLKAMGADKAVPDGSHAFYQQRYTPKWSCNAPSNTPPLLMGGAPQAPVEEPNNLSGGSVVVHGRVIRMKNVKAPAAKAPAAAPAKAKAAAPSSGRRLLK
ncbi:MAG: hypothetical protein EBS29_08600 [Chloroflexia bacterium]|nr:hypothetical protein [Chloroflexia bacterium]